MFRTTLEFVPEDEVADQSTMFGGLRKKLAHEFEGAGLSDKFEHLKVYLRVRPFTTEEILASRKSCISVEDDYCVTTIAPKDSNTFKSNMQGKAKGIHKFKFSKIFRESTSQSEFYDGTLKTLVEDFLMGQNCLVYAYGVTNAGKTYTVQGDSQNPGLLPRTLDTIFTHMNGKQWPGLDLKPKMFVDVVKLSPKSEREERNKKDHILSLASVDDFDTTSLLADSGRESCPLELTKSQDSDISEGELVHAINLHNSPYTNQIKYSVWISFAEVYNEQVFDLLEEPSLKKRTLLKLGEDKNGNPYIRGLTEVNVSSTEEALKLMTIGQKNLRKASTKLNHNSSRSHCIFNIKLLRIVNLDNPKVEVTTLSLCDLAGSERACKTHSTGDRLKEASNINTSLLTLGRCIEMMRANKFKKDLLIPYRDSKLTRLFQGFFSGRGKAVMIVNVNKCSTLFDETLQVFKFSAVAKQVVIQQKIDKQVSLTISPVLPLANMERASIPWEEDGFEISCANNSIDETMEDEEHSEKEKKLLEVIDKCYAAIQFLQTSLAEEKKERMGDEIRLRYEITKELMDDLATNEMKYSERMQYHQLEAEEEMDSNINKMLANLNPKKRARKEVDNDDEEMVPLHEFQKAQNEIKSLTVRLESTKKQMRRMTNETSKVASETSHLQFTVSDMLRVPSPHKAPQGEMLTDNLEQANVLNKMTAMLSSAQDKLKEKQTEVCELEDQLKEAGEAFHENQKEIDELKQLVKQLQETNKNPPECLACKVRSESSWQLNPELKNPTEGFLALKTHFHLSRRSAEKDETSIGT